MSDKDRHGLNTPEKFLRAGIQPGTKLHLHVTDIDGPHMTDEAVFVRLFRACGREVGLIVRLGGQDIDLVWDDVIECWPVPEPPDPRFADGRPPEAAGRDDNLDTAEKFEAANVPEGARLALLVRRRSRIDGTTHDVPLLARFKERSVSGLWLINRQGERQHERWDEILECRLADPVEIDPRYQDGRPPAEP